MAPVLTSLSPTQSHSGVSLTLTGTGLTGTTKVTFGSKSVVPTSVTATSVACVIPPTCAGQTPVTVTTAGVVSNSLSFFYIGPPSCGPVDPTTGPAAASTVTIYGSGLLTATGVTFGAAGAGTGLTVVSDNQLSVTTPVHGTFTGSTDTVNVTITTAGGGSVPAGATSQYTFYDAPTVTAVVPGTGLAGSTITITGTNLVDVTGVTFTPVGGGTAVEALDFTSISGTQARATVPVLVAGTYDVQAITPGGTSAVNSPADQFTVV
ncbi:cell surface protein [Streptomyces kaniharaensis]|uniref:Cell surface protein n=1 Tax=Streptomyces kaniharaensis TaxID=212423 RepID=A0A6N7KYZ0_9ACTN|nr:IPT/TIG domain-containing protein [Streptomyces kaniharaensis]MQS15587.1 cell surface protein [Streptomyces kaniharaensis]